LRSLVVAAGLARALLERVQRDPARVLHGRVALAPLRQLWIAWRTARRAAGPVTP
jgi:phytoene synthase